MLTEEMRRYIDVLNESFFFIIEPDEYNISSIDTTEKKKLVFETMEKVFGHLDLGPGNTVESVLHEVDWPMSYGIFHSKIDKCFGTLLLSMVDLKISIEREGNDSRMDKVKQLLDKTGLSSIEGVALYIDENIPTREKTVIVRKIFQDLQKQLAAKNIDFIFGKAVEELNNMGFWDKHSVFLGKQNEDGIEVNIFALPFSAKSREIFKR